MYIKIIFIIFVCALRYLNARPSPEESPIREAIQGVNPELNKLTARLKNLKLDLLRTSLKNQIENQKSSLGPVENLLIKIEKLDLKVIEVRESNTEENANVDKCIDSLTEKMERILTVARSKANQNLEKNNLQTSNYTQSVDDIINKSNDIERNMNKLIGYCIRQNSLSWQKGRLKSCLRNETELLNLVVDKLDEERDALRFVRNTTARDGLEKWFSKIEEQFNSCIFPSLNEKQNKGALEDLKTTWSNATMMKYNEPRTETKTEVPKASDKEHQLRIINRIKNIKDLIRNYVELRQNKEENANSDAVDNLSSDVAKKEKFILIISA